MIVNKLIERCKENDKEICFVDADGQNYSWYDYLTNVIKIANIFKQLKLTDKDCVHIKYKTNLLNNPMCHFIMVACMYSGICFINGGMLNSNENDNTLDDDIGCKLYFFIDIDDVKYSLSNDNNQQPFDKLLKQFDNIHEHIQPYVNNNKEKTIFSVIDVNYVEIDENKLENTIQILRSNYGYDKGVYLSHMPLTTIESVVFDVFFHVLSSSVMHFYKNENNEFDMVMKKIKEVKPTFIYGDALFYKNIHDSLKTNFEMKIKSSMFNIFPMVIIEKIKEIMMFCHSYDLKFYKSSIIILGITLLIGFVYYFMSRLFKIYRGYYGLDNCKLFVNIGNKLEQHVIDYFYSVDIPIKYVFSCMIEKKYHLVSLTNKYENLNVGHLVCNANILNNNNLLIDNVNTDYKGIILDSGKLQLIYN
jgi:long-subunit acyl-CoA synthetase (AMP-forming)